MLNIVDSNPFEISLLDSKPLVLDGGFGSYLQQRGFGTDDILWATKLNHTNPEEIIRFHLDYIDAGADLITTNTFRTNPASLSKAGIINASEYVKEAVKLAKQASIGKNVLIAGSNAPAEDCYQKERTLRKNELEKNHKYHIDLLIDSGVNFILNETQSHFDELKIICDHCDRNGIPYAISLYFTNKCELLSGESLDLVLNYLNDHNAMAIGFNCINPALFIRMIGSIRLPLRWGFYLNCGNGNHTDNIIYCGVEPDVYLQTVKKAMLYEPSFVGSCCGSSPAHTKKIREFLDGQNYS